MPLMSYCERVSAGPTSPVHIRIVGPEGRKFGGGIPSEPLCGTDLRGGWDLPGSVSGTIHRFAEIPQNQPGRMCLACVDSYHATGYP